MSTSVSKATGLGTTNQASRFGNRSEHLGTTYRAKHTSPKKNGWFHDDRNEFIFPFSARLIARPERNRFAQWPEPDDYGTGGGGLPMAPRRTLLNSPSSSKLPLPHRQGTRVDMTFIVVTLLKGGFIIRREKVPFKPFSCDTFHCRLRANNNGR